MSANIFHSIEQHLSINAPVQCVYNQCSQFKEFSRFAPYVMSIRQYDDYPIRVQIWFREKRFNRPREKFLSWPNDPIAHRSLACRVHQGSITLEGEGGHTTRVTVELDCSPPSPLGRTEDSPCTLKAQVEAILMRFRNFVEPQPDTARTSGGGIPGDEFPALTSETQGWTRY